MGKRQRGDSRSDSRWDSKENLCNGFEVNGRFSEVSSHRSGRINSEPSVFAPARNQTGIVRASPSRQGTGIAIARRDGFVSLEASIRECMASNSPLECPAPGTHSVNELRRYRQRRLHPDPKLPVVQPVQFRCAHRQGASIEVDRTNKFESHVSRKSVEFSTSLSVPESAGARCKKTAIHNEYGLNELGPIRVSGFRDFPV
jgi:hypothetical protein